jgi:hypothetical protein
VQTVDVVRADASGWISRLNAVLNRPSVAGSLIAAVAVVAGVIYLILPPTASLLNGDTPDYLYFDAGRPIGYPIFVRVVWWLTDSYAAIRPVQMLIFIFSASWASWAVFRYGWGGIAAISFQLGVLGHPGPVGLADSIMSDSLAASLYLFYLAAVLSFVRAPALGRYAVTCVVMALLITVRPVGVALIASNLALLLLYRRDLQREFFAASALLLVLAFAGWFVTPAVHSLTGGEKVSTPLARGLVQKVIFEEPEPAQTRSCEEDFIENLTRPALEYMRTVPAEHRDLMRLRYSTYLRFKTIIPGLVQRHHFTREAEADPILMCYSLARIRENPLSFLHTIAHDYWTFVTNHTFITARQRDDYNVFRAAHPPVLPPVFRNTDDHYEMRERAVRDLGQDTVAATEFMAEEIPFDPPRARPEVLILALKLVQVAATFGGLACILLVPIRLMGGSVARDWVTLGVLAIAAQVSLIITSVVEIALPRYVFPIWPYYWITIIVLTIWAARSVLKTRPLRSAGR